MTNHTRAAIAHDLHIQFDRSDSVTLAYLFEVLEFVIGMSAATHNRDVRWTTYISKPARNIHWIIMTPTRDQNSDRRTPCFVGITVSRNILPTSTRSIDQRHRFRCSPPHSNTSQLDVRNLNRDLRFP